MGITLDDVSIEFCTRNYPLEAEPICALWQYDGTIYLQEDDDDDPTRIGTMLIYRLLPAVAHDAGVSLRDALDYISEDTAQYIALLDDEGTEFNEDVRKQYDDCICSSLLILDSVEIDQAYRGHGIGLLAARHAIELAENGALVACRPFPLQFAGYQSEEWKRDHPSLGQQDFEAALEKLRRYCERLGFSQYLPTDIWCLSTEVQIPTIDDIASGRYAETASKPRRARHRHRNQAL